MWKDLKINLQRERLLAITNIIVMTLTFLFLSMFVYVVAISQTALKQLEDQAQITVFFKDDFPESKILDLQKNLQSDPRVAQTVYVSKAEAFKIFTEIHKDEPILLKAASPTILPASLEIKAKDLAKLSVLADEFGKKDGVEEVKFYRDVIERFRYWGNIIYAVGFVLTALFLIISYSIVLVTLRLTINAKGTELEILKLVGATDTYVKAPLLFEGTFFGIVSAVIASVIVVLATTVIKATHLFGGSVAFGFVRFDFMLFAILLCVILLISGTLLGYFGSSVAVKKYLKY
ncbi:MAG TPA: permease-like cell division protein FtsX [Candidatus Saccharimonadales bacterium]|nr:permease-like cell division protein FtsX [Candidatus Saccharimonadales bacterium]